MSTVSHYQNSSVRELGISETIKRCSFRQRFHEWIDAFLAGLSSHCCGTPMAARLESYDASLTRLRSHMHASLPYVPVCLCTMRPSAEAKAIYSAIGIRLAPEEC